MVLEWTPPVLAIIAGALFAGGLSKGATGLGLPPIATPIIAMVTDVPTAIGLIAVPFFVSNLWQTASSGFLVASARRFWKLLLALPAGVAVGGAITSYSDPDLLFALLGAIVAVFAATSLLRPGLHLPEGMESSLAIPVGFSAGVIGGLSSLVAPILASFMLSLKLEPDEFVGGIGLMFCVTGLSLTLMSAGLGLLPPGGWIAALLAVVPVVAGQVAGRAMRRHIDAVTFRRIVLVVLLLIGLNLLRRAIFG